tara:strand:+ start:42 stop:572 length:531 start_codon:yes stop_codon:yes gene_type:complete
MKKLLLLLLIVPSIGNSQVKSFDDLKQINSVQQFKKVVLENGYEKNLENVYEEFYLSYGVGLEKQNNGATDESDTWGASYWASYITAEDLYSKLRDDKPNEWAFEFPDLSYDRKNGICYYDIIVDEIKNQCKFYKVGEDERGREIVLYSCVGTSYQGKIGYLTDKGLGIIKHLIGR